MKIISCIALVLVLLIPASAWTAGKRPIDDIPGYRDTDRDGKNDLFQDANGDGINDVTGKPYSHRFTYSDTDGDGKNDLFQDANGDGVNDILQGSQKSREPIRDVLDFDGNGINDVTGTPYRSEGDELDRGFIDEDGDGIRDEAIPGKGMQGNGMQGRQMDRFQDEDGDGINDGRGFGRQERRKGNQSGGKGEKGR